MPYQIIRNDIVTMSVDAIVNPTDAVFSGSGGVDARVHFAAGPQMRTACDQLPVLDMGQVAGRDFSCPAAMSSIPSAPSGLAAGTVKMSFYRHAIATPCMPPGN